MNKFEKVFTDLINEGSIAAKRITDSDKKAMAYAALAQAIATSNLMLPSILLEGSITPEIETDKEESNKESLKTSASKGKGKSKTKSAATKVEEEILPDLEAEKVEEAVKEIESKIVEEQIQEQESQDELSGEWTDEMLAKKDEQINLLNSYIDSWTQEYILDTCMTTFFEVSQIPAEELWNYIRPTNIDAFIAYLESLCE